jgi:hypothetical protein
VGNNDNLPAWRLFEDLVRRILEANDYQVRVNPGMSDLGGFDFNATYAGLPWAIDVKYYRTARPQTSLLDAAAARLVNRGADASTWNAMLIVSCSIPAQLREALEAKYPVTFVDRSDLWIWAARKPELADEFAALVETEPGLDLTQGRSSVEPNTKSRGTVVRREDRTGTDLCTKLRALKKGKKWWSAYEELCERILRYLFPNDLSGWHKQKRTTDELNRFDFVCRIRPRTDFWKFLIEHLDSRYVVFEFKNYAKSIKQGQVLTTEKYLLERGLRRVAIVLTRAGADEDATKMAQGSMREHGKLILVVDDDELCEMLHMKERGEDPTDRLFDIADEFLLTLPR